MRPRTLWWIVKRSRNAREQNMTKIVDPAVSEYMRKIGAKGGAAGSGTKKRRPKDHYRKTLAEIHRKRKGKRKS